MLKTISVVKGDVADGVQLSDPFNYGAERWYLSAVFYTDETCTTVANPTAGTVKIEASETGEQWGEVGTVEANLAGEDSTYDRLTATGAMNMFRVTTTGVIGATYFKLRIFGYE